MLGPSGKNEKYIYSSLDRTDWARFVKILPSKPEDEISCRTSRAELSHCPDYEALSYTWGDSNVTDEISCNGQGQRVATNLRAALRRLRYPSRPRKLWIDAICVNQGLNERSQQVRVMSQIYSKARQVVIWENSG
jgi:hypothetical protein